MKKKIFINRYKFTAFKKLFFDTNIKFKTLICIDFYSLKYASKCIWEKKLSEFAQDQTSFCNL